MAGIEDEEPGRNKGSLMQQKEPEKAQDVFSNRFRSLRQRKFARR
jgi:hypothetical protein